jgi:hypothetical protein
MFISNNHESNTWFSFQAQSIVIYCLSIISVTCIISLGLYTSTQISGYHIDALNQPVNRSTCVCDCWDGYFRGRHGRTGYKTFYFNYEQQTIVILGIVLFYSELLRRYILNFIFHRHYALCLVIPSIYSNFYGAWSIMNYLNDHDYHRMLKSQTFFSVTELIATYIFTQCLMMKAFRYVPISYLISLSSIACLHIFLARNELHFQHLWRNTGLLLSDVIALLWLIHGLIRYHRFRLDQQIIGIWCTLTCSLAIFYYCVCPFREKSK